MTNGQIAQLQELSKCYGLRSDDAFDVGCLGCVSDEYKLSNSEKAQLRRLTHQYRHQIKAMKRNRKEE